MKHLKICLVVVAFLTLSLGGDLWAKAPKARKIASAEYIQKIANFYSNTTWTGTFKHLYLPHEKLTITLKLGNLNLIFEQPPDKWCDGMYISLIDKSSKSSGEVLVKLGDKTERFEITELSFVEAYICRGDLLISNFWKAWVSVKIKKGTQFSQLSLSGGLLSPRNYTSFGSDTDGELRKQ